MRIDAVSGPVVWIKEEDPTRQIPDELVTDILGRLSAQHVALTAAHVCSRWRRLAFSPWLWDGVRLAMLGRSDLVAHVLEHVPGVHIAELDLGDAFVVHRYRHVEYIAERLGPGLKALVLPAPESVVSTRHLLQIFTARAPLLTALAVRLDCSADPACFAALRTLPLRSLRLHAACFDSRYGAWSPLNGALLRELLGSPLPLLHTLNLHLGPAPDKLDVLHAIAAACPELRALALSRPWCHAIPDDGADRLELVSIDASGLLAMRALIDLRIGAGVMLLDAPRLLRSLPLHSLTLDASDGISVLDLSDSPTLLRFSARRSALALVEIARCPRLEVVTMEPGLTLSHTELHLSDCPALHDVTAWSPYLTAVARFLRCPAITVLHVNEVSYADIITLDRLSRLSVSRIAGIPDHHLDVSLSHLSSSLTSLSITRQTLAEGLRLQLAHMRALRLECELAGVIKVQGALLESVVVIASGGVEALDVLHCPALGHLEVQGLHRVPAHWLTALVHHSPRLSRHSVSALVAQMNGTELEKLRYTCTHAPNPLLPVLD